MTTKTDFWKQVVDLHHTVRKSVEQIPIITDSPVNPEGAVDKSVKEQVISDLDRNITEAENKMGPAI